MTMLRLITVLMLGFAAPARADYANLTCSLTLTACEMARDMAGTCPAGSIATLQVYAEGDTWFLQTTGIGPDGGERTLDMMVHQTEPSRVYYLAFDDSLYGAFSHDPAGAAKLTLSAKLETSRYEEYWAGTCEDRQ
jgi:hypothetical protein